MDQQQWLSRQFEQHRPRLRAVAWRMLGSASEADDALQDVWIRVSRAEVDAIENLDGWLTTVVTRVCLNMLRSRARRREQPFDVRVPDPVVDREDGGNPENTALLADSVGLALLVVLDTLGPEERLAFVLHDMFAVPFDQIGAMIDRTPTAARQLASRARRRVRGGATASDPDLSRQREVVNAFFAASREGDFEALVAVLAPDAVLRSDGGSARPTATALVRGGREIASRALTFASLSPYVQPALVNGAAGAVIASEQRVFSVMAFTVAGGKVIAIDALVDPVRLRALDLSALDRPPVDM